jgi:hypothetical protein
LYRPVYVHAKRHAAYPALVSIHAHVMYMCSSVHREEQAAGRSFICEHITRRIHVLWVGASDTHVLEAEEAGAVV